MYLQHAHHPVLQNILGGISAVAAGLLIATGIRMLLPHRGRPTALLFAALAFGLMLQPVIGRRRPDVVYLSEWETARVLARLRRPLRQR